MKIVLCFVMLWLSAVAAQAGSSGLKPTPDQVYRSLASKLDTMIVRKDLKLGPGGQGRLFAWSWGYLGRASLMMYQATGEQRFLDLVRETSMRLLELRDHKLNLVDDDRKRIIESWGTKYRNGVRSNEITAAGLITLPMCQYALLTGDETIGKEAVRSLSALLSERKTAFGGYYFPHLTQKIVEPLNHAHVYGAALAYCSLLPYAPATFKETALGIYKYWQHFVRPDGPGVSWAYMPAPTSPRDQPSEAVWKAGVTIELPIALIRTGLIKDDGIIDLIEKTIVENPIVKDGGIPQFIGNGRLIDISKRPQFHRSSLPGLLSPVVLLDRPAVDEAFQKMVRDHPKHFPGGWFGGSRSMLMSYAYLLSRKALSK